MSNIINIGCPQVSVVDDRVRLSAKICIPQEGLRELWFEVAEEYGSYLCAERSDAFVFGLLNLAQRRGWDISCEAPMSAELHYRLTSTLIPALAKHGRAMHATKILAELADEPLPNVGAVGTGCSCGIDSLHVLKNHLNHPTKALRLTHLVLNNAGAFRADSGQYGRSTEVALRVAQEEGLKAVITNSNIAEFYSEQFEEYNTYANMFCVLALRKLWKTFFYGSSGHDLSKFSTVNNEDFDSGYYDLMSLSCLSTDGLTVYSEGGALNRFEKTRDVYDFPLARKYLNVCQGDTGRNCSTCEKCRRTLLNFDALGGVEPYRGVFDLAAYRRNKNRFVGWALWRKWRGTGGDYTNEALLALLPQCRIKACFWAVVYLLRRGLR